MRSLGIVILTFIGLAIIGLLVVFSGFYNISARVPHWDITLWLLNTARDRSISFHAAEVKMPNLDSKETLKLGLNHFHATCRRCHGAPGYPSEEFARGLFPAPPSFSPQLLARRNDSERYWIIQNGIKMTGMPAFGNDHGKKDIAAMIALINRLPDISKNAYQEMISQAEEDSGSGQHHVEDFHGETK
jgi:mono/diheme cytochrome c family protein